MITDEDQMTALYKYVIYLDECQISHDHLPHVLGSVHVANIGLKDT